MLLETWYVDSQRVLDKAQKPCRGPVISQSAGIVCQCTIVDVLNENENVFNSSTYFNQSFLNNVSMCFLFVVARISGHKRNPIEVRVEVFYFS